MPPPSAMRTWQLPASVRSLALPASAVQRRRYSVTVRLHDAHEPLRILFCGSDSFSIASLRALNEARRHGPNLIDSIHVVHRPAKLTGRGLTVLREVPVRHVATEELGLPTHVIDTFTGWAPPVPINLVVAVSFGLLVPARILGLARYGGLNVHPSLLPDLRGPAPIQHAILQQRERTGVSVQTLHPKEFDRGTVLAQTSAPGISIPHDATALELENELALAGAQMLVQVLESRRYVPPHQDAGWYADSSLPVSRAPKTTKQDRRISFDSRSMDEILAIQRALGDSWCMLRNGERLILHDITPSDRVSKLPPAEPGLWIQRGVECPLIRTKCGTTGIVSSSTYSGGKTGGGNAKVINMFSSKTSEIKPAVNSGNEKWERIDEH